jgi:hypothetical protein
VPMPRFPTGWSPLAHYGLCDPTETCPILVGPLARERCNGHFSLQRVA